MEKKPKEDLRIKWISVIAKKMLVIILYILSLTWSCTKVKLKLKCEWIQSRNVRMNDQ